MTCLVAMHACRRWRSPTGRPRMERAPVDGCTRPETWIASSSITHRRTNSHRELIALRDRAIVDQHPNGSCRSTIRFRLIGRPRLVWRLAVRSSRRPRSLSACLVCALGCDRHVGLLIGRNSLVGRSVRSSLGLRSLVAPDWIASFGEGTGSFVLVRVAPQARQVLRPCPTSIGEA